MNKSNLKLLIGNIIVMIVIGVILYSYNMASNDEYDFPEYPEDFLTMQGEPIDYSELPKAIELYSHIGANGMVKILDYGIIEVVSLGYDAGQYGQNVIEHVYKDKRFVTSEGIHVGLTKEEVIDAYNKYDIKEYTNENLVYFNVRSSIVKLAEYKNENPFLYVDNSRIFVLNYKGVDYWGGLGAYIFIFDDFNIVEKILLVAPTSG